MVFISCTNDNYRNGATPMHSMALDWIPKHSAAFDDIIVVLSTNVDGIFVPYMYFWKVMTSSRKVIIAIF
jgi:hypothetical protein